MYTRVFYVLFLSQIVLTVRIDGFQQTINGGVPPSEFGPGYNNDIVNQNHMMQPNRKFYGMMPNQMTGIPPPPGNPYPPMFEDKVNENVEDPSYYPGKTYSHKIRPEIKIPKYRTMRNNDQHFRKYDPYMSMKPMDGPESGIPPPYDFNEQMINRAPYGINPPEQPGPSVYPHFAQPSIMNQRNGRV